MADVWGELTPVLNPVQGLGGPTTRVWGELPSALGALEGLAGPVVIAVRGSLPSALGRLQGRADVIHGVKGLLTSPLRVVQGLVQAISDEWGNAGFPLPKLQGYSYQRDAGLHRTDMYSGVVRQRRRWDNGRRTSTVSFEIPTADLYEMEEFINSKGCDWFGMSLVTADNTTQLAQPHLVRVMADPSFGELYGDNVTVTLNIEMEDPIGVTIKPFNPYSDFAILFIDEAHGSYVTDYPELIATSRYMDDLAIFQELPDGVASRTLVFFVRNELWEANNQWVLYPSGTTQPVPNIVTCPRVGTGGRPDLPVNGTTYLSGQFIYDAVEDALGFPALGFRRAYVFVDTSGSMAKENLGTALEEFYLLASGKLVCNELICSTERWLKWIYNVNNNSSECV